MFLENKVIYVISTDQRSFRTPSAQDQRRSTISAFPSQKSSRVRIQITKKLSARWRGATNNGKVSLCGSSKMLCDLLMGASNTQHKHEVM